VVRKQNASPLGSTLIPHSYPSESRGAFTGWCKTSAPRAKEPGIFCMPSWAWVAITCHCGQPSTAPAAAGSIGPVELAVDVKREHAEGLYAGPAGRCGSSAPVKPSSLSFRHRRKQSPPEQDMLVVDQSSSFLWHQRSPARDPVPATIKPA